MDELSNDVYKETYYALTENTKLINSIPSNVLLFIKKNAKKSNKQFDFLSEDKTILQLSKKALELYTYLYLKFGELDDNNINKIKEIIIKNSLEKSNSSINSIESYLYKTIENEIISQVRKESEEIVNEFLSVDDIAYESELYNEMKQRLDDLQIEWNPFLRDTIQ
ncbi:MAG: hypothetical protein IKR04_05895 [Clostridia bacterium]|nr:hypothetical protein [Clostridia bacterium]